MRWLHLWLISSGAFATQACVWTQVRWMDPSPPRPSTCTAAVRIYPDSVRPPQPFIRLADIAAVTSPGHRPDTRVVERAVLKKAARIGANGLVFRPDRRGGIALYVAVDSGHSASACGRP
jgi:hypothetical protein